MFVCLFFHLWCSDLSCLPPRNTYTEPLVTLEVSQQLAVIAAVLSVHGTVYNAPLQWCNTARQIQYDCHLVVNAPVVQAMVLLVCILIWTMRIAHYQTIATIFRVTAVQRCMITHHVAIVSPALYSASSLMGRCDV